MPRRHWRPEPTTNTTLLLLKDRRGRVMHVAIGSALLDADWGAAVSLLSPQNEAPLLVELFCYTPREAHRAFRELFELGDVDPDSADFEQEWYAPAAGLATVNWLLYEASQPRSKARRLLNQAAIQELDRIRAVLIAAERQRRKFHFVEVQEREGRRFAGREIRVGPENDALHLMGGDGEVDAARR